MANDYFYNIGTQYAKLLESQEWKTRRDEIIERDGHKCAICNLPEPEVQLHVHHRQYYLGLLPWEYEDDDLITLCESCHRKIHDEGVILKKDENGKEIAIRLTPCPRCNGTGYLPEFNYVENGICFKCRGARFVEWYDPSFVKEAKDSSMINWHSLTKESIINILGSRTIENLENLENLYLSEAYLIKNERNTIWLVLLFNNGLLLPFDSDLSTIRQAARYYNLSNSRAPLNINTLEYAIKTINRNRSKIILRGDIIKPDNKSDHEVTNHKQSTVNIADKQPVQEAEHRVEEQKPTAYKTIGLIFAYALVLAVFTILVLLIL